MAIYKQFYEDGVPMGKPQNPKLANPAPQVVRPRRIGVKRPPGWCPEGPQNTRGFEGISSISIRSLSRDPYPSTTLGHRVSVASSDRFLSPWLKS
jgi:hypothetical protein